MIWRMDWLGLEVERERENAKEEEREGKSLLSERRLGEKGEGGTYRRPWTTETLYIDPKNESGGDGRRRKKKERETTHSAAPSASAAAAFRTTDSGPTARAENGA